MSEAPLDGIRVLSLEQYLAGNHGTWLMAMFGAEILKVERPDGGDVLRRVGPTLERDGRRRSGGELRVMTNKRSLALDITTPEGHRLLFDLVEHCDVVWTNQKPSDPEASRDHIRVAAGPESPGRVRHTVRVWPRRPG